MAVDASQIREHMEVVGSDGDHVGVVDMIDGDKIKLTKSDPESGGQHRYIDLAQVDSIDGDAVCLSATAAEAKANARPAGI
jgi:hypothetical protein